VTAFGVNAYWAEQAGDELIEEHDELGAGAGHHEELYVVIGGAARFTVAGDEFDAPTRTVVFVRDPAARRGAIATEANTTALAVGGAAGQAEVSPWESVAHAIPAWKSGDHETARATIEAGLEEHPDNPSLLYDLACLEALSGDADAAIGHLRRAVELKPEYAKDAQDEEDFASIRARPEFPTT
jgi:tetratricopeptide (TPR) repeat protein